MNTINAAEFFDHSFFLSYTITYMPGIKVSELATAKVVVNTDSKQAYIYHE